jgi:hypothetical protein
MKKINRLTAEQEAKFPDYIKQWTEIGLSTEVANRPRAEMAIRRMYEIAGLPPPKNIVWCGSPLSMAVTRAILLKMPDFLKKVRARVRASVRDSVWTSVGDSVGNSVEASVRASVRDSVEASVRTSVGDSVGNSVWASVVDSVRASVVDSVWDSVGNSVWDSVVDSVEASVEASVWASVRDSVVDSVWDSVRTSVVDSVYGQHDAPWLAFYRFFHDQCGLTTETQRFDGLWEFAQSAGWATPCRDICFIAERHTTLNRDERGRLHCETGPAVGYPDGWGIFAVHGVRVPESVVVGEISLSMISAEKNTEIQRVMIERFGWDRYALESKAEVIDHDERWGTLMRSPGGIFLRVINRSPEPDGSFRNYILPVWDNCEPLPDPADLNGLLGDPQKMTALNAVASTFGMRGEEYQRLVAES